MMIYLLHAKDCPIGNGDLFFAGLRKNHPVFSDIEDRIRIFKSYSHCQNVRNLLEKQGFPCVIKSYSLNLID
jgi:hypothetical protein